MLSEETLRAITPIYIPYFNQPTYILRFVSKLISSGFLSINILVNGPQLKPSNDALILLEQCKSVKVLRLRENYGPRWLFSSELFITCPQYFIYTDPDLELTENLPENFLSRLINISEQRTCGKVGCALAIEPELFSPFNPGGIEFDVIKSESAFWQKPLGDDLYDAPIDTTFVLVNKKYLSSGNFFNGIRVAGQWTIKHLPFYKDTKMPKQEWDEYNEAKFKAKWVAQESILLRHNESFHSLVVGGKDAYERWLKERGYISV